ncbi:hypothetical protein N9C10_01665 [Flavobacteriaceae bacterium]|nr:hypothetical protein [Flavobacteriaceae bacterium]
MGDNVGNQLPISAKKERYTLQFNDGSNDLDAYSNLYARTDSTQGKGCISATCYFGDGGTLSNIATGGGGAQGTQGAIGSQGAFGTFGLDGNSFIWEFEDTGGAPGAPAGFTAENAGGTAETDYSLTKSLNINYTVTITDDFKLWLKDIKVNDNLYIRRRDSSLPLDFVYYEVTSVTQNTNYVDLGVNLLASNTTSSFVNTEDYSIGYVQSGSQGTSGSFIEVDTLATVVDRGNVTSNIVSFQNTTTAFSITEINSNIHFDSNVRIMSLGDQISIGQQAGQTNQGTNTIAIGNHAGNFNQEPSTIAIGFYAGESGQSVGAVSLGYWAGKEDQGSEAISVGQQSGEIKQGDASIAVGHLAGQLNQNNNSIAIGFQAAQSKQNSDAIAIGYRAGELLQNTGAVSLGFRAGRSNQLENAIAIGLNAGEGNQNTNSIAIGNNAGTFTQNTNSIAIGNRAGRIGQRENSIAIGNKAGETNQHDRSIVINAQTSALESQSSDSIFIKPIRNDTNSNILMYNELTGEITYDTGPAGSQGAIGSQGSQGANGTQGAQGAQGETGMVPGKIPNATFHYFTDLNLANGVRSSASVPMVNAFDLDINGGGEIGWPILPHGGGAFYNVLGEYINGSIFPPGIPISGSGWTYANFAYIPAAGTTGRGFFNGSSINYYYTATARNVSYEVSAVCYGPSGYTATPLSSLIGPGSGGGSITTDFNASFVYLAEDYFGLAITGVNSGLGVVKPAVGDTPPNIVIEGQIYINIT